MPPSSPLSNLLKLLDSQSVITKKSLRKAFLKNPQIGLNRLECHLLVKSFQQEDGRLDKQRLLTYLKDPLSFDSVEHNNKIRAGDKKTSEDEEYVNLMQTLSGYMIEKDISIQKVTEWFRVLDVQKDGTIRLFGV